VLSSKTHRREKRDQVNVVNMVNVKNGNGRSGRGPNNLSRRTAQREEITKRTRHVPPIQLDSDFARFNWGACSVRLSISIAQCFPTMARGPQEVLNCSMTALGPRRAGLPVLRKTNPTMDRELRGFNLVDRRCYKPTKFQSLFLRHGGFKFPTTGRIAKIK